MNLPGFFRRFYSTGAPPPKAASSALVSSTPRAVRIRRKRFPESTAGAKEDSPLSDVEQTTYNRLKARAELTVQGPDGLRELSEEEWLQRTNAKRRRVRGTKQIPPNAETERTSPEEAQVVGHRIYLPNIIFRLVRNYTPPGEPYNPFEATFRVPQSVTKLDIRGYLLSMYGVRTTYIRTDNRIADIRRNRNTYVMDRWDSPTDTYKRAVVGLEEPFHFPQAREDMDIKEREARDEYLNGKFQREEIMKLQANFRMRVFRPAQYRNAGKDVSLRGKIIRRVMEQKMARESAVTRAVKDMLADPDLTGKLPASLGKTSIMRFCATLVGALSALVCVTAFNNPVLWEDLADLDIRRVNNTYYYSSSTMHYSPGAPILRSYDLFNWEYIRHSVPTLDFGSAYSLPSGSRAYVKGIWASFFGFHSQKNTWYWGGCVEFSKTYIYSASSVTGPWTQLTVLNKCYYDCGLLVDDDGIMYVSYIYNNNIWVAQLSSDGKSEVKSQQIYVPPSDIGYLEGSRMYKRNGVYYILLTKPPSGEYTIKASSPFGTYTIKNLVLNLAAPGGTNGGNPHQGGLVDTPSGQWYYMAFIDAYPGGRIPVLAPVTWGSDGFPAVMLVNGKWGDSYTDPATAHPVGSLTGVDYFTGSALGPQWEWNHNPDTTKFSVGSGLVLKTATVTTDLYQARNTLSHRILGPISTATIKLSYGSMKDGDRAGLVLLRDVSAWVGVRRDSGAYTVAMVSGLTMDSNWNTNSTGSTVVSASISGGTIWLRATADIRPSGPRTVSFSYSTDGSAFKSIGSSFVMINAWQFFMGYRFGIFNYATSALGGQVTVANFQLDSGTGGTPASGGMVRIKAPE